MYVHNDRSIPYQEPESSGYSSDSKGAISGTGNHRGKHNKQKQSNKTSSSNTMTVAYPANSQGLSLGNSASFVIAINQNGTIFTFVETLKY